MYDWEYILGDKAYVGCDDFVTEYKKPIGTSGRLSSAPLQPYLAANILPSIRCLRWPAHGKARDVEQARAAHARERWRVRSRAAQEWPQGAAEPLAQLAFFPRCRPARLGAHDGAGGAHEGTAVRLLWTMAGGSSAGREKFSEVKRAFKPR